MTVGLNMSFLSCESCHMAPMAKSAVAFGPYEGDISSHLFAITTEADDQQFYEEDDKTFSNGYITVEYACLRCHDDKDRNWALAVAPMVHDN